MMKRHLLFNALITFCVSGFAQNATLGKKVLMEPKAYLNPIGTPEPAGAPKLTSQANSVWIVFSDRPDNPTYMAETGGNQFKKMNFMEAFYVMDEKGEYLHLAKYELDPALIKNDKLTRELQDYGWAPKSNLLCWKKCLVDSFTKFTIKALSINSVTNLNDIANYAKGDNLKIFSDPGLTVENANDVRLFDFLYIYKRTPKAVLIGTTDMLTRLQAKRADQKIMGWVSSSVINEWKDRVTLEPNWDPEAVRERKNANVKTAIFSSDKAAAAYKTDGSIDNASVLWQDDPMTSTRKIAEWKRLPYINSTSGTVGLVRTGAVSNVFDSQGQEVIKSDEQSEIERAYNQLRENYRKVNIVFVIDGSEVMFNYATSLYGTIAECANALDKKDEEESNAGVNQNEYKLGLVVYRDYSDKECGLDKQEKTLTTNYNDIADFLTNEVKFKSCKNTETRRAMYDGIKTAVRQFQDTKDQTNIIILIGAGGNNDKLSKTTQKELIDLLAQYRVGLLSFQAMHPSGESYNEFILQAKNLIKGTAQKIQGDIAKLLPNRKAAAAILYPENMNNVLKLRCPRESPVPGVLMYADILNPINPTVLKQQVFATLQELEDSKEDILNGMESKLKGQGTRRDLSEGMAAFLTQMKVDINLLRKTSFDNIQLFVEGFTTRNCDKLKNPLYKYCIFLSYTELSDLINQIKRINESGGSRTEARKNMQEAFLSLLAARIGPKEAKKKMGSVSAGDLLKLISGLPVKNELLNKVAISDITKEKVISETQLEEFRLDMTNKLDLLEKYKEETNYFQSNDINYYWVPEDLFP